MAASEKEGRGTRNWSNTLPHKSQDGDVVFLAEDLRGGGDGFGGLGADGGGAVKAEEFARPGAGFGDAVGDKGECLVHSQSHLGCGEFGAGCDAQRQAAGCFHLNATAIGAQVTRVREGELSVGCEIDAEASGKAAEVPCCAGVWIGARDLLQIRMLAISHIQFSSLFQRSERFKHEGPHFVPGGYSLEDGSESYGWIARYTKEFLESYLKHDRNAHAFLMHSPAENQVPSRLMTTSFRPAS
jgi:hypothetical protein